jgi:ferredoxin-NADP reductase/Na+-transporting NADH:ubiquinone oxidoreductase subunit NqrB
MITKYIDRIVDSVTMYKVVVYSLLSLIIWSFVLSFLGKVSYTPISLLSSLLIISATTLLFHTFFEFTYKAPANTESSIISLLITFLIVAPPVDKKEVAWIVLTTFFIIASKYLVAYKHRHIFNPVAIGLVLVGILQFTGVTWWSSSRFFTPLLLIVGIFVIRKVRRETLFFSYIVAAVITTTVYALVQVVSITEMIVTHVLSWPLLFLGIFMVTEPLTTPPTKHTQMIYGGLVGALSSVPISLPPFYSTPELALCLGNIFSYSVSMRARLYLTLKERVLLAKDTYEFIFSTTEKVPYNAGQYMEWTLPHDRVDMRGMRRYFTIASNPEDKDLRLGIKYFEGGSTFKKTLMSLQRGEHLNAAAISGDFVLPARSGEEFVFIAGGIGITPFVSILRSLMAQEERKTITLFYANKTEEEIAYKDVLEAAKQKLGLQVVHILADKEHLRSDWAGETGFLTEEILRKYVQEPTHKTYYLSGPPGMVGAYTTMLKRVGVKRIHTDYFPGFA